MQEETITPETAKLSEEKGFVIETTVHYYEDNGGDTPNSSTYQIKHYPTQSLLQKWLREQHGIHILIIPTITANWTYKTMNVISERDNDVIMGIKSVSDIPPYKEVCAEDFSTYELALEACLQETLKLIAL